MAGCSKPRKAKASPCCWTAPTPPARAASTASASGVISPFDLAGITKAEIRQKSRELGLPNWAAPSAACLASRIPYGTALTAEVLRRVELAEDALIALGFVGCRVRLHGTVARIEAPKQDIIRIAAEDVRMAVIKALKPLGFEFIALDIEGYRMGSMN